ncbi:carboxylesterase family protein [Herbihabitans rhizosphaerae]|uniref:Carboxylesterase family protein n=1 Tax=Herbihabitans rhizosphaerae TaxID=1872711 RepID=A0A4Q7KLN6_9PSEU|nr:carboxylesterase family protein [Herbihabitans rhizosphaerae]RZS37559.1 carboxylesterase family protein [Herbihabitans rhizosphaerae]
MPYLRQASLNASALRYLFHAKEYPGPRTPEQRRLAEQMVRYWTAFARTGDPNGPGSPPWLPGVAQRLDIGPGGVRPFSFTRQHHDEFWRSLRG